MSSASRARRSSAAAKAVLSGAVTWATTRAPVGASAPFERAQRLGDDAFLEPRQHGRSDGDPQRSKRRDRHGRRDDRGERRLSVSPRVAEGNDLDGRDHVALLDRPMRGQGGDGDRLVDRVEPVDRRAVDDGKPRGLGEQVDPSGEGRRGSCARKPHRRAERAASSSPTSPDRDARRRRSVTPAALSMLRLFGRDDVALLQDESIDGEPHARE